MRERQEMGGREGRDDMKDRPAGRGIQTGAVCREDYSLNTWGRSGALPPELNTAPAKINLIV